MLNPILKQRKNKKSMDVASSLDNSLSQSAIFEPSFSKGTFDVNFSGYAVYEQGKYKKDYDIDKRESAINFDFLEEHNILEMKVKLEDEMQKNEQLERQIREFEFVAIKK